MRSLLLMLLAANPTLTTAEQTTEQRFDSMVMATELGAVLASEALCNLSYDQAAITAWVNLNVAPDDMSFAPYLQSVVTYTPQTYADLTESAKTAHCAAITQTATHYGFLK